MTYELAQAKEKIKKDTMTELHAGLDVLNIEVRKIKSRQVRLSAYYILCFLMVELVVIISCNLITNEEVAESIILSWLLIQYSFIVAHIVCALRGILVTVRESGFLKVNLTLMIIHIVVMSLLIIPTVIILIIGLLKAFNAIEDDSYGRVYDRTVLFGAGAGIVINLAVLSFIWYLTR